MRNSRGYITLLSVLVVGAVGVALTTSVILLGLGSARSSFSYTQSVQARSLAGGCVEEALEQIRINTAYTGSGSLSTTLGTCSYAVASGGGQNRTITATSTVMTVMRKASANVTAITPLIVISTWQEVP